MKPESYQQLGGLFVVVWDDGHESYYAMEDLRRSCPCAFCAGEPDLFGRLPARPEPQLTESSLELQAVERVGNYALQFNWADGHSWGLWTHDRLRALCPCEQCRVARGSIPPS
ncbi:MAG: DUF971 domain-containing protein [Acidobacteriota bacterium]